MRPWMASGGLFSYILYVSMYRAASCSRRAARGPGGRQATSAHAHQPPHMRIARRPRAGAGARLVAPRADERAVGAQRGGGHVAERGHGVVHVHVHQHHARPERALQLAHAPGQVLRLEQVVPAPRRARGPFIRHRPCPPGPRRRVFKASLRRRHAEPRRARLQAHRATTRGRRARAPAGGQPLAGAGHRERRLRTAG